MWMIESGEAAHGDVDEKLNALLDSVSSDPDTWAALTSKFDADVFVGLFMEADNEGLTIEPRTMRRLGQLGLALHFDIYALGTEAD